MSVLLEVKNLATYFYTRYGTVKAVDDVSFFVKHNESFGIVGESGCGKSITCLSILGLVPKPVGKIVEGKVFYRNKNLLTLSEKELRKIRGKCISMILQDPMTSLNPVFTIGNQVSESIKTHQHVSGKKLKSKAFEVMSKVNIPSPKIYYKNWPHQLSGGMRQRIVGAIAISCEPELLIADEPTTALDATIQIQYLKLLFDLQKEKGLAIIFITHDLGIIAKMCQRAAVMYAGRIIETANVRDLFAKPAHPYTKGLLESLPNIQSKASKLMSIEGKPPVPINLPKGCVFAPRCKNKMPICTMEYPSITDISKNHSVSCWLYS